MRRLKAFEPQITSAQLRDQAYEKLLAARRAFLRAAAAPDYQSILEAKRHGIELEYESKVLSRRADRLEQIEQLAKTIGQGMR